MAVLVTLLECKSSLSMDRSPVWAGCPTYPYTGSRYQHYQLTAYFPNLALIIVPHDHTHPNPTPAPGSLLHLDTNGFTRISFSRHSNGEVLNAAIERSYQIAT